ncbi:putative hydroxypyruvate isomerase [Chionoecetes opilio]|uniref:Putative hydroxypyruvate isomerase n=1 Tax=Chionoecetes opilio TaxID=41210 RepID=A0A8J4YGL0_CHIOP|nr:putative hydroxypyruvate isomerase [Chionoecetes opilio]
MGPPDKGTAAQGHSDATQKALRVAMALRVCGNLTTLFPERGALIGRVAAARKAGFRVVEVSLPYRETSEALAKELHDHQLEALLINSDPGNFEAGEMGCACQPGKEAQFKTSLDKSLMYAKALNVSMIHVMVGKRLQEHTEEEHATTLEDNLRYATALFKREGIVGVIEPKNNHTFPGYFLNDFEQAVALLFKIDSPHLRLLLDIFHLQLICGNVTRNIDRLLPYTGHVQVSQPPQRSEPGSAGELDYAYVIAKLKSAGYKGFIGAEYMPSTKKTEDSLASHSDGVGIPRGRLCESSFPLDTREAAGRALHQSAKRSPPASQSRAGSQEATRKEEAAQPISGGIPRGHKKKRRKPGGPQQSGPGNALCRLVLACHYAPQRLALVAAVVSSQSQLALCVLTLTTAAGGDITVPAGSLCGDSDHCCRW